MIHNNFLQCTNNRNWNLHTKTYDHNWFKYSNSNNISAIYSCLASVGFWIKNCCMNLFLLRSNIFVTSFLLTKCDNISMGTGNTIVLLFSAEMLFKVCRYLSYNKIQLSQSTFFKTRTEVLTVAVDISTFFNIVCELYNVM